MSELFYEKNLNKNLTEAIQRYLIKDKKLINNLRIELSKKGINPNVIFGLIDGVEKVEDLDHITKQAFTKVIYKTLEIQNLNYEKYYSAEERLEYEEYSQEKESINEIVCESIQKVDDYNFIGRISYKQIYDYMMNFLFRYNMKSQRAYKISYLGTTKKPIREIDINKKNVSLMTDLILSDNLEDTEIIINIRIPEDEEVFEPNCKFESYLNELNDSNISEELQKKLTKLGRLTILPNNDVDSETFTVCEILDGYHRILAVVKAVQQYYDETGQWLEGGLDIRFVMRTLTEAKEFVRQIFERSDTNKNFQKSLKTTDYTVFVENIINNSKILKNNVADNYQDQKTFGSYTNKVILADFIEQHTSIPVEKKGIVKNIAKTLAETVDTIIDTISYLYFDDDIEKMKNTNLLTGNIFVGYLTIADYCRVNNLDNMYEQIAEKIYCLTDVELKELKLTENIKSTTKIYNFFLKLIREVEK